MRIVPSRQQFGITLVEVCIATTIATVLAAIAVPSFKQLLQRRLLEGAASQLATDLRYLRSESVARNRPLRIAFGHDGAGSCYVLYAAEEGECSCDAVRSAVCTGKAQEIKSVGFLTGGGLSLQSNVSSMLFDPVYGTTTPGGAIRLVHANGAAVHQIINITGRVRTCTPNGVPGYKEC